jgi:hypothetical protein
MRIAMSHLSTVGAAIAVLVIATFMSSPLRAADPEFANLGQLLNTGAKLISPQQFKDEIVQRSLVGALPSGVVVEVMYTSGGTVAGTLLGSTRNARGMPQNWPVSGSWTIDESERICTGMQISEAQKVSVIPVRCQFWFKLGDTYYVCDSDEDRSAKVLARAPKR